MNKQKDWITRSFDQFGDVFSGSTPSTANRSYWNGSIVWVTPNDLSKLNTRYVFDSDKRITEQGLKACSATLLLPKSIIISARAPIGYVAISTIDFCTNQGCKSIRVKSEFDPEFTYYNIIFNIEKLKRLGEGTTFAEISKTALCKVELNFPKSKIEQAKIAEVLSTVDKAISETEALIAKQQRIKTGLMQDLLTRGIDENGNLRSEETHQFKDSPLGRIPVEWEVIPIGKLASLQRGHDITEAQLCTGQFPVISSSGIIGYHNQATSKAPNVVVGRKGTIGKIHYVDHDFWAHDTSLYVTNFRGNYERFVYYLFDSLSLERFGTKSGSPSLNRNDIHPLLIGKPSREEQEKITQILFNIDNNNKMNELRLRKLHSLKTALMQDLLTGKKRINPLLENNLIS